MSTISARIRITRVIDDDELGRQIEPKMRAMGGAMGVRAQRLVPKRSFALNDTIGTDTVRRGARVTTSVFAGSDEVDYALHVERGTSRAAAQPYLRPAMLQVTAADFRYSGPGPQARGVRLERRRPSRATRMGSRR